jgi:hypothetical protein
LVFFAFAAAWPASLFASPKGSYRVRSLLGWGKLTLEFNFLSRLRIGHCLLHFLGLSFDSVQLLSLLDDSFPVIIINGNELINFLLESLLGS